MTVRITPAKLSGSVRAVASKSHVHRLLICAALSDKQTVIRCADTSEDIAATVRCLVALGGNIVFSGGEFTVTPITNVPENAVLDCGESGSTLRFMLPVACALGKPCTFKMSGRLPERPLSPLWNALASHGVTLKCPSPDTIVCGGKLRGGVFNVDGGVSSQFISGLLLAAPLLEGETVINISGSLESEDYISMTRAAQADFGVVSSFRDGAFTVKDGQKYSSPAVCEAEGDWSNGAFWLCAGALSGGAVKCVGLRGDSVQGDKRIAGINDEIAKGNAEIDGRNIPDLIPIISVLASVSVGKTVIKNAARLRFKESDRLRTTADMINGLGGIAEETEDGLVITGKNRLRGGIVNSAGDHRIAMSAAVASIACEKEVAVFGAEAVRKSYPAFWNDFCKLGGKIRTEDTV